MGTTTMCLGGRLATLLLAVALAACTTTRRAQSDRPHVVEIPDVRARIVFLAEQEWRIFGGQTVTYQDDVQLFIRPGYREEEPPHLARVLAYWQANTEVGLLDEHSRIRPWSAAFISWVLRQAGVRDAQFRFSVLHWDYIEAALEVALVAPEPNRFRALDAAVAPARPGDLLCAPRAGMGERVRSFGDLQRGFYHCDIVVSTSDRTLEVIGGNVGDSVSRSIVELDAFGRARPTLARPWVVVLSIGSTLMSVGR